MNLPSESIYDQWAFYGTKGALLLVILSSAIYIFYAIIAAVIGNRSKKYGFILNNETSVMWIAAIGFCIAIAMVFNVFLLNERDFGHMLIFSLKAGLPIGVAITVGYGIRVYLTIYYPFVLDKKLADIRFRPRKHPKTGNLMRLLNEEEEDKYLSDEMIRQEEEFQYDFDVWLDENTGKTIIETYKGTTNAECERCHFKTLKLVSEEVDTSTKEDVKHFECSHCGNKVREVVVHHR